jgi:hypothetical protein
MSEQNTHNLRTDIAEHDKYNLLGKTISAEAAHQLLHEGSTDALPGFMGEADPQLLLKNKKDNITSARVKGTTARHGELYPTNVELSYSGMFSRGLAKIRRQSANVQANIIENRTPLTAEEIKDPDNPYKALYKGGEDE